MLPKKKPEVKCEKFEEKKFVYDADPHGDVEFDSDEGPKRIPGTTIPKPPSPPRRPRPPTHSPPKHLLAKAITVSRSVRRPGLATLPSGVVDT